MYETFFSFERPPFSNTPDSRFFFPSERHREALAQLRWLVEGRKGFAVLTGAIGSGKTTLIRTLLREIDARTAVACVTNSRLTGVQLLFTVAREYGLAPETVTTGRVGLLEAIHRFLIACLSEDRRVLLIVDEGQDLPLSTLEEIRLISNLETDTEKLIQILLVGQPELDASIDHPSLRQLRQRIALRFHLTALEEKDSTAYIEHRLRLAGPAHTARFTGRALSLIHRYARGIPRLINLAADRALLLGFTREERKIAARTVIDAIREVEGSGWTPAVAAAAAAEEAAAGGPRRARIRLPFFMNRAR